MATELGVGYVSIVAETSKLTTGINKALSGAKKAGEKAGKDVSGGFVSSMSNGLAKLGQMTWGVEALGKMKAAFSGVIDYASEAEQSYGAVESTFKGFSDGIISASKDAADAVGVSGREYRELASYTGAMLKNMGMPLDEVSEKAQGLIVTASDMAATFGGSTTQAIEAVNAALRGETDPIERYGVSIRQADINAQMAAMGLSGLTGEAEKQARAQAMLALLTKQTADAAGQFSREQDTAAHKIQVANAQFKDAKEAIGNLTLPFAGFSAQIGGTFAAGLAVVSDSVGKSLIPAQEHITQALNPALSALSDLMVSKVAPAAAVAAEKVGEIATRVIDFAVDPSTWEWVAGVFSSIRDTASQVAAPLTSLGSALFSATQQVSEATWHALIDVLNALAPVLENAVVPALLMVGEIAKDHPALVGGLVLAFVGLNKVSTALNPLRSLAGVLMKIGTVITIMQLSKELKLFADAAALTNPKMASLARMGSRLADAFNPGGRVLKAMAKPMATVGKQAAKAAPKLLKFLPVGGAIAAGVTVAGGALWGFFTKTETGKRLWQSLMDVFHRGVDWIKGVFANVWDTVVAKFQVALEWISKAVQGLFDLFVRGDFTVNLGEAFGIEEDSRFVGWALSARDGIITAFTAVKEFFGGLWQSLQNTWGTYGATLVETIRSAWDGFVAGVKAVWGGLSTAFFLVWSAIRAVWSAYGEGVIAAIRLAWEGLKTSLSAMWDGITTVFSALWDGVKLAWESLGAPLVEAIKAKWSEAKTILGPVFQGMRDLWETLVNAWHDAYTNLFIPLLDSIKQGWQSLKETFGPVVQALGALWDAVIEKFREFRERMAPVIETAQTVATSFRELIAPALEAVRNKFAEVGEKVSEFIHAHWEQLEVALGIVGAILVGPIVLAFAAVALAIGAVVAVIGTIAYVLLSLPGWVMQAGRR